MQQKLIELWFSDETRELWYNSNKQFDELLVDEYLQIWHQGSRGELDSWMETALGSLALVILLDQLPLNMFRGEAKGYSTEALSRDVAKQAIDKGFDKQLTNEQAAFLFMPYMHSENLEDQKTAQALFQREGLEGNLRFAKHHMAIVEEFGRFPHRNKSLGRESSEAEIVYLNSGQAFTG